MIPGFVDIVKNDYALVKELRTSKEVLTDEQTMRISAAAIRLFATAMMGLTIFSAVITLRSFTYSPVVTVLQLAICAIFYALWHDVFHFSKNFEGYYSLHGSMKAAYAVGHGTWSGLSTYLSEQYNSLFQTEAAHQKDPVKAMRAATHTFIQNLNLTENTNYKKLWDKLIVFVTDAYMDQMAADLNRQSTKEARL